MLTKRGIEQAQEAGKKIKDIIKNENYGVYYSPYFRTRQTKDNVLTQLTSNICKFQKEDPRLREQEYSGKLQDHNRGDFEKERNEFGKFFYRGNGGESAADVFDRISDFLSTLNRDFTKKDFPKNIIISGHGMSNRVFIMRFFHFTVEEFEMWKNPRNGEIYVLELHGKKYKLITILEKHLRGYGFFYPTN
jgi:broad specificity phosphatase PhoE